MGTHLATIDMGRKLGGSALFGGAGSPRNTMWPRPRPTFVPSGILIHTAIWPQKTWTENWGRGLRTKWHLDLSSRLATIDIGRKLGGGAPFFGRGSWGPHLSQCGLGRGLPTCQVPSWSIQPFGHNRHGPKIVGLCPFWGGGAGSPSIQCGQGRGLPACQVSSWSIQLFGHNTPTSQTVLTGQNRQTVVW